MIKQDQLNLILMIVRPSSKPVNQIWRVSGELITFAISVKPSGATKLHIMLPKYCKTFDSPYS